MSETKDLTEKMERNGEKSGRVRPVRGDFLLLAGILLFSLLFWLAFRIFSSEGKTLAVMVDGETVMTLPLDQDTEQVIRTEGGRNTVRIRDGKASCTEADCPDKICVKHSEIDTEGETIICLPHKLVLEVEGR